MFEIMWFCVGINLGLIILLMIKSYKMNSLVKEMTNKMFGSYGKMNPGTGTWNTAVGANALECATDAERNTVMGCYAGSKILKGKRNVIFGNNAQASDPNAEDELVIGSDAVGNGKDTITIGSDKTKKIIFCGDVEFRNLEKD